MPCASGFELCKKPGGSDTASPAHTCAICKKNVHVLCSEPFDDPTASFGEGHRCLLCLQTDTPTPPQEPTTNNDVATVAPTQTTINETEEQQPTNEDQFNGQEDEWVMPSRKGYNVYIVRLMSFYRGSEYPKGSTFTKEQLLKLTPQVVTRFLAKLAYGKQLYDANKDHPTHARSSSIE